MLSQEQLGPTRMGYNGSGFTQNVRFIMRYVCKLFHFASQWWHLAKNHINFNYSARIFLPPQMLWQLQQSKRYPLHSTHPSPVQHCAQCSIIPFQQLSNLPQQDRHSFYCLNSINQFFDSINSVNSVHVQAVHSTALPPSLVVFFWF